MNAMTLANYQVSKDVVSRSCLLLIYTNSAALCKCESPVQAAASSPEHIQNGYILRRKSHGENCNVRGIIYKSSYITTQPSPVKHGTPHGATADICDVKMPGCSFRFVFESAVEGQHYFIQILADLTKEIKTSFVGCVDVSRTSASMALCQVHRWGGPSNKLGFWT